MLYFNLFLLLDTAPSGNPLLSFGLPQILMFGAIFYFVVFMPMQRQKKQQQQMLRDLQNGDVVITTGGIVGTIVSVKDDRLVLRVKPGDTKLEFLRSAVASKEGPPAAEKQVSQTKTADAGGGVSGTSAAESEGGPRGLLAGLLSWFRGPGR